MEALASGLHPEQVDELPEYRSISVTAVVGLLLALFSPLALVRALLVVIPVAAAVLCLFALYRIRTSEGRLAGRAPALVGLGLACFFAAAAPAKVITWRRTLNARATPVALAWLELLQAHEPHKAHQLMKPDLVRRPLTDDLWTYYRNDAAARRELEEFVSTPEIKFLLTMGDRTQIRFYEPIGIDYPTSTSAVVMQTYTVSYDDPAAGRTTFFLSLMIERREAAGSSGEQWRIGGSSPGVTPTSFQY
jgi:hypothetical protein